jgi:cytochrome bd ubiquinol oxidase subunit II
LNIYGLLGGVLFLLLFMVHGSIWLSIKSEGDLQDRAVSTASKLWPVLVGIAVVFLVVSAFSTSLYNNFLAYPALFVVILLAVAALFAIRIFLARKAYFKAWFASAATIVACTFYGVIGLFPNMFPSNIDAAYSLTAHNASSSPLTLKIMLVVVVLFVPIVLAYQIWTYHFFKGKVTEEEMVY